MDGEEINSVAICDGSYQYIDWTKMNYLLINKNFLFPTWGLTRVSGLSKEGKEV